MNAVKRCLALIAATLLVGACGGDPTADDAGAGLTIRATPGAVWVRNNSTAGVLIEAVDKLGGPTSGSWSVTNVSGPFNVVLDSAYQNTSTGSLGVASRYVITPTSEGDGSMTIEGTGGTILIPIRIAPDSSAFAAVVSNASPTIGDTITITAPAGTRFTSGTTVNFYNGPLALNLQQGATPKITSIDAPDSTVLHVIPPAGAEGQARITGISNPSTPSLTVTARTVTELTAVDTKTLTGSYSTGNTGVAPNTPITITLTQPGYRFRDGAGGGADTSGGSFPFSGSSQNGFGGRVIDSTHMVIFVPPGYNNVIKPTKLFNAAQPFYNLSLPMADSMHVDSLPQNGLGDDDQINGTVGQITVPSLQVGESYVFWDNGTFTAPNVPNAGGPQQWVEVAVTDAGTYTFTASWDGSADVDNYLFVLGATTFGGLIGDCGSCGANPEVVTTYVPLTAGQHINYVAVLFDGAKPTRLRVTVTRDD